MVKCLPQNRHLILNRFIIDLSMLQIKPSGQPDNRPAAYITLLFTLSACQGVLPLSCPDVLPLNYQGVLPLNYPGVTLELPKCAAPELPGYAALESSERTTLELIKQIVLN